MTKPPPVVSEAMDGLVRRALNSERGIGIRFPNQGLAINWKQRYYTVRKNIVKSDPSSEWRTLTCIAEPATKEILCSSCGSAFTPWIVKLIPNDAHVADYDIEEL
jgi:hypothetical protein